MFVKVISILAQIPVSAAAALISTPQTAHAQVSQGYPRRLRFSGTRCLIPLRASDILSRDRVQLIDVDVEVGVGVGVMRGRFGGLGRSVGR
jgi:hypothetical protein